MDLLEGLDINKGLKNSLAAKLNTSLKQLNKNKVSSLNVLQAFLNELRAQEKRLTGEQMGQLVEKAQEIISLLEAKG